MSAAASAPSKKRPAPKGGAEKKEKKQKTKKDGKGGSACRYDNSLGLLTKKFVLLLQEAEGGVLDLNIAASKLDVQKRRIYDITNVLEGIGLIEKKSKNNIQWKGSELGPITEMRKEMSVLQVDLDELARQEALVDEHIEHMQNRIRSLCEDPAHQQLAYLTHDDVRNLPNFKGETLIAIKAPHGTTLEVPDPDQGMPPNQRRYQIWLKSRGGPVDVYLVSNPQSENLGPLHDAHALSQPASRSSSSSSSDQHFTVSGVAASTTAMPPLLNTSIDPPLVKLQLTQPPNQDFLFNMDGNEGISDFYAPSLGQVSTSSPQGQ